MIIPGLEQRQIMKPSSPVPVGNADTSAEAAMVHLGQGMVKLGNELDRVQKESVRKTREYQVEVASRRFEEKMILFNQQKLWEEHKDITGLDAAKISLNYAGKVRESLMKEFGFSGDDALRFDGRTRSISNDLFPKLMVKSSEIVQKNLESARAAALDSSVARVFANPEVFNEELVRISTDVAEDPDVLNKQETISKYSRALANGVVARYINGAKFGEARKFVAGNAQVFGTDLEKEMGQIEQAHIQYNNRVWTDYQRENVLIERRFEAERQEALTEYTDILKQAGNDQFKFNLAQEKIQADRRLKAEDKKNLATMRAFMETQDDQQEADIFSAINQGKLNILSATKKVETLYIDGQLSVDRKAKILRALENVRDFQRRDPTVERLVSEYFKRFDDYAAPRSVFDIQSKLYKGVQDQQVSLMRTQFANRLADLAAQGRYTPGNIEAVYKEVLRRNNVNDPLMTAGARGRQGGLPRLVNPTALEDAKSIQKELMGLSKQFAREKGKMTPQQKKEMQDAVIYYNKRKDFLIKQNMREKDMRSSPSGGDSGQRRRRFDE